MAKAVDGLADALGWFSIGLGLAQVAAPRAIARLIGIKDSTDTQAFLRLVGVRELATGVGIFSQPRPIPWLWARVGGDVMDLAFLRRAVNADHAEQNRVARAMIVVLGVTALDLLASRQARCADESAEGHHRQPTA